MGTVGNKTDAAGNSLNAAVTSAIILAERLPVGSQARREAFRKVMEAELAIARVTTPTSLEGAIARQGVVTAALEAGAETSAQFFAEIFSDEDVPESVSRALMALVTK